MFLRVLREGGAARREAEAEEWALEKEVRVLLVYARAVVDHARALDLALRVVVAREVQPHPDLHRLLDAGRVLLVVQAGNQRDGQVHDRGAVLRPGRNVLVLVQVVVVLALPRVVDALVGPEEARGLDEDDGLAKFLEFSASLSKVPWFQGFRYLRHVRKSGYRLITWVCSSITVGRLIALLSFSIKLAASKTLESRQSADFASNYSVPRRCGV